MPKTGRNDACPCGSGKKYKRCCLAKDQAAEIATLSAQRAELDAQRTAHRARIQHYQASLMQDADELTAASNAVIELVRAGKLDEAEQAARELLVRYPEVHDGYDRLGMVYEARGENQQAAQCYRKVIEFAHAHPENYEPDFETTFRDLIAKLDPPPAADQAL
jgi:tetratricopeptide (TPR) repeat protein